MSNATKAKPETAGAKLAAAEARARVLSERLRTLDTQHAELLFDDADRALILANRDEHTDVWNEHRQALAIIDAGRRRVSSGSKARRAELVKQLKDMLVALDDARRLASEKVTLGLANVEQEAIAEAFYAFGAYDLANSLRDFDATVKPRSLSSARGAEIEARARQMAQSLADKVRGRIDATRQSRAWLPLLQELRTLDGTTDDDHRAAIKRRLHEIDNPRGDA
jgi:hypothetical protein